MAWVIAPYCAAGADPSHSSRIRAKREPKITGGGTTRRLVLGDASWLARRLGGNAPRRRSARAGQSAASCASAAACAARRAIVSSSGNVKLQIKQYALLLNQDSWRP